MRAEAALERRAGREEPLRAAPDVAEGAPRVDERVPLELRKDAVVAERARGRREAAAAPRPALEDPAVAVSVDLARVLTMIAPGERRLIGFYVSTRCSFDRRRLAPNFGRSVPKPNFATTVTAGSFQFAVFF